MMAAAFRAGLESAYVHDVQVHQVVTTSQLDKMRLDPKRWLVKDVGPDRHAVTHCDPTQWFDATPHPLGELPEMPRVSPATVEQARRDFADSLLTRTAVAHELALAGREVPVEHVSVPTPPAAIELRPGEAATPEQVQPLLADTFATRSHRQVVLVLEESGDPLAALEALRATIDDAGPAVQEAAHAGALLTFGTPTPGPSGPLVPLLHWDTPGFVGPDLRRTTAGIALTHLTAGLQRRGVSGRLRAPDHVANGYFDRVTLPTLSAVLLLPLDLNAFKQTMGPGVNYCWPVDPHIARSVLGPAVAWVTEIGGATTMDGALVVPEAAVDLLVDRLPFANASVRTTPHNARMRLVRASSYGMVVVHGHDAARSKAEQLEDLSDLLRGVAPHVITAFIREIPLGGGPLGTGGRLQILGMQKPLAMLDPLGAPRRSPGLLFGDAAHLEGDFVYDAFVHQVVTAAQRDRMRLDPQRWQVTDLGKGRYAVRHLEPERWFDDDSRPLEARTRTSPVARATLDRARHDFRDALLTKQTLAAHPPDLNAKDRARFDQALAARLG